MLINTATACTQDCNQGRNCTCCVRRMPAEAATEVGADQDEPREPMTPADVVVTLLIGLSSVLLVVSAGHFIARLLS